MLVDFGPDRPGHLTQVNPIYPVNTKKNGLSQKRSALFWRPEFRPTLLGSSLSHLPTLVGRLELSNIELTHLHHGSDGALCFFWIFVTNETR